MFQIVFHWLGVNPSEPNPISLTPISDPAVLGTSVGTLHSGSDGPMLPDGVSVMVSVSSYYDPACMTRFQLL